MASVVDDCELCRPASVLCENDLAYARLDSHGMSAGHVIVVPRRHVADFFDMSVAERNALMELLAKARDMIQDKHRPDGYNIGANVGRAAGQGRMHVHFHLIPRYEGDVADPRGGIRCVLGK
jgi:diadenosine tetraphosphate (Ap4A) HIT family hydrolase